MKRVALALASLPMLGAAGAVAGQEAPPPLRGPEVVWNVIIPTGGPAVGNAVTELTDGGLAVAGYATGEDGGVVGVLAVLDAAGSLRWVRRYGGEDGRFLWDVDEAPGGGLVAAGFAGPPGAEDVWLMAVTEDGEMLWERRWGGAGRDRGWSLDVAEYGGWVVAAETTGPEGLDAWVIRATAAGDTLWARTIGGAGVQRVYSVAAAEDGGAVVAGGTGSDDRSAGDNDLLVARIGPAGELVWRREIGGDRYDVAHAVARAGSAGGGFLVTAYGTPGGNASGDTDVLLLLLDERGETTWLKRHPGPGHERAMMSAITGGGGWLTVGFAMPDGEPRLRLSRSGPDGDELWRALGAVPGLGRGVMVAPMRDGTHAITGAAVPVPGAADGLRVARIWTPDTRR